MTILPIDPASNATPEALGAFLAQCRALAAKAGRMQLVSITLSVPALDPLAVLESIFEPGERHFYVERPAAGYAVAGAEAVLEYTAAGADRFEKCQRFIDDTLANALVVGDQQAPFSGPHFFTGFSFLDQVEQGEPFAAATIFVPRWQVALAGERTIAVANFTVAPDEDLRALAGKVWRAHQKFVGFEYRPDGAGESPVAAPAGQASPLPSKIHAPSEVGDYRVAVARGLQHIAAGEFQKIVLARALDFAANEAMHPLKMLNGLRQRFRECYAFSMANGQGQSFMGASPERLLRVSGGRLETEALAGSTRRGVTASEDAALGNALLQNEKDVREQRHVLDSIIRRLAPLGLKLEYPSSPGLRKLANVQHLHTPVSAVLPEGVRLLDMLARLHPTPAVGGTPREAAVARIREIEGFPRGLYAGALGWIDARGNGEFFVGLRSALIAGQTARLYAGAGIVAGSSPDKEFDETEIKFRAIRDALLG